MIGTTYVLPVWLLMALKLGNSTSNESIAASTILKLDETDSIEFTSRK